MTPREELLKAAAHLRVLIEMAPWWVDTKRDEIIHAWLVNEAGQHIHLQTEEEVIRGLPDREKSVWEGWAFTPAVIAAQPVFQMARWINDNYGSK